MLRLLRLGGLEVLRKSGLALSDKEDWVHLNLNTRPDTLPPLICLYFLPYKGSQTSRNAKNCFDFGLQMCRRIE